MEKSEQEKLKLTREMLKSADQNINSGIILCGVTKDKIINYFEFEKGELGYNEKIKFIVLARGISTPAFRTWTIHIGQPEIDIDRTPDKKHMDNDEIAKLGLRLNLEQARILVDCSDEVMDRYDDGSRDRYIRFQKGKLKEEHTEEEYKKLCKVMF